jgi:hypothetical protein
MKYKANPVIVDAFKIEGIVPAPPSPKDPASTEPPKFLLDNGKDFIPHWDMLARIKPVVGDYVVIQPDGYTYLNPAAVFTSKYTPISVRKMPTAQEMEKIEAQAQGAPITVHKDGMVTVGEKPVGTPVEP